MKDYIDVGFMKLFEPTLLFKDFEANGTQFPLERNELFEQEKSDETERNKPLREKVANLDHVTAARTLKCSPEENEFMERLFIIDRMTKNDEFAALVSEEYLKL